MRVFMRLWSGLLLVCFLAVFVSGAEAAPKSSKKKKKPYSVSARAAILIESDHLKRHYEKEASRKVLPASTTKVMTAILVLEKLRLDQVVTVSQRAANALPSKLDMKVGETYRVRDLLEAILLKSANDASVALAEAVAGSEEKFVDMMNARALKLGAKHTRFANSHGLPTKAEQYTTAYDMALIFREALKKSFFKEAIAQRYASITSREGRKINLKSHNSSLFKGWKQNVRGKTGYTNAAGACFVGYLEHKKKLYIIAVFNSGSRWDDVKFIIERYTGADL